MASEAIKLKTLEDLLSYSEDARVELIDGNIVERAMPRSKHGQAQSWITQNVKPFDRKPVVYRFQSGEYVVSATAQSGETVVLQPFNIDIEIGVIFGHETT